MYAPGALINVRCAFFYSSSKHAGIAPASQSSPREALSSALLSPKSKGDSNPRTQLAEWCAAVLNDTDSIAKLGIAPLLSGTILRMQYVLIICETSDDLRYTAC
jgi:hypothetical protein